MKLATLTNTVPSLFGDLLSNDYNLLSKPYKGTAYTTHPPVNIWENEDAFYLELAVPGYSKKDFHLELNQNKLNISSDQQKAVLEDVENIKTEFSRPAFNRLFTLPNTVNGEKITAKYEEGILLVTLPKREEAKPKPALSITVK